MFAIRRRSDWCTTVCGWSRNKEDAQVFLTRERALSFATHMGLDEYEIVSLTVFATNGVIVQDNSDPTYRKQWISITKENEAYCLVPVPVGKEPECLFRAQELVTILNQHHRMTCGTPYSEKDPCQKNHGVKSNGE